MIRLKRAFNYPQTGAVLVEFAIVVPFLLLLVLGISEFSYAFFHLNILNKSVQDGALYFTNWARCNSATDCSPNYAINTSSTTNSVNYNNTVNLVMTGNPGACSTTNPPLLPNCANYKSVNITSPDAEHIQVTATYQHSFMTGSALTNIAKMFGSGGGFSDGYNLTASSVMRAQ